MLLEQLQANQGKKIVIELVNGRIISGAVLAVKQQFIRMETDEGVGTIPIQAIHVIWEAPSHSLTRENMDQLAKQLRDSVKEHMACAAFPGFTCAQRYICSPPDNCTFAFSCPGSYMPAGGGSQCQALGGFTCTGAQFYGAVGPTAGEGEFAGQFGEDDVKAELSCTSFPGFNCAQRYACRPPDNCTYSFNCPGRYVPAFPSSGGGCGPYEFGQHCGPRFSCRPYEFGQHCGPRFGCRPYEFGQQCGPRFGCRPYEFGQQCGPRFGCRPYEFGQQCGPRFGCRPFQFGGSQCGTPGGFTCAGQQFFGLVGPPGTTPGSQCGTPGGFTCAGQQFFGLVGPPGGTPGSQCGTPGGFTCFGMQFTGAPIKPPGTISKEAPLPPTDFSMDKESQNKDTKE